MSVSKAALWSQISTLLAEHERAQTDAIRLAVAETWQKLRQGLTVISIESEMPESGAANDDGGDPP